MDRVGKLRVVYWLALANVVVLCVWGLVFDVPGYLRSFGLTGSEATRILPAVDGLLACCFLLAAAPIGYLIHRPLGWGKLLMPVYGFAWIMHGVVITLLGAVARFPLHVTAVWVPIACGVAMFALAIAHQVIDPSFSRARPA